MSVNNASPLPFKFDYICLDSSCAVDFQAGNTIATITATAVNQLPTIHVQSGAKVALDGGYLGCVVSSDVPIIQNDGGILTVTGTIFEQRTFNASPQQRPHVVTTSGGDTTLVGTQHRGIANKTLTKPVIQTLTGRTTVIGAKAEPKGTGSGVFIASNNDDHHVYVGNVFGGYDQATVPGATKITNVGNAGVGSQIAT